MIEAIQKRAKAVFTSRGVWIGIGIYACGNFAALTEGMAKFVVLYIAAVLCAHLEDK